MADNEPKFTKEDIDKAKNEKSQDEKINFLIEQMADVQNTLYNGITSQVAVNNRFRRTMYAVMIGIFIWMVTSGG